MTITVGDYIDVKKRATELGCRVPDGWAVLPRNFSEATSFEELVHESNAATVRTLLRRSEYSESPIEPDGKRLPQVQENAFTWIGPIIFIAAAEISRNPEIVSVACGLISNYLTDFFKGKPGDHLVKLDIVVEQTRTKRTVKLHYEGPLDGLTQIPQAISEACGDTRSTNANVN